MPTLGYWAIRGLGAAPRLLCAHAGAALGEVLYSVPAADPSDRTEWTDKKVQVSAAEGHGEGTCLAYVHTESEGWPLFPGPWCALCGPCLLVPATLALCALHTLCSERW